LASVNNYVSYNIKVGSTTYASQGPILSILTYSEINKIPHASIMIMDGDPSKQDFALSSENIFNPGEKISIELGYDGTNNEVFSGIIIRHRIKSRSGNSSALYIECKHAALKMVGGRKTNYFESQDDKAILTSVFGDSNVGGSLSCSGSFLESETSLQLDITNWDYFMLRCEANAKVVLFDGDNVIVDDPKLEGSPVATFNYGQDIFEFESEADAENQFNKLEGFSWDSDSQEVISAVGNLSSFTQLENIGINTTDMQSVLGIDGQLSHGGEVSADELESWGNSKATIASLSKVIGRIKIAGNSDIKIGDVIEIKGVGEKFSGNVMVSAIKQVVNNTGWFTDIQFGLNNNWYSTRNDLNSKYIGNLTPSVNGLQIGKVLKIDGDEKYRVQIALPVAGEDVQIWARMVFEDAGNNRGKIFWPEIDDEVIVGFLNSDPRNPVILGSLFSKTNIPPILPDADNFEKGIITKEKVKIIINDEDKSVNIETPEGNSIFIDDETKSIILEDQNQNSITMDKSGITISSQGDINIESSKGINITSQMDLKMEGMNIENTANAKFSADGQAGAELTTSAIAVVKGSMVQIN
jgi:Rhs element Vgr protein